MRLAERYYCAADRHKKSINLGDNCIYYLNFSLSFPTLALHCSPYSGWLHYVGPALHVFQEFAGPKYRRIGHNPLVSFWKWAVLFKGNDLCTI